MEQIINYVKPELVVVSIALLFFRNVDEKFQENQRQ